MKPPTWATARDILSADHQQDHVVRLQDPKLIARVTKAAGGKLVLTVRKQRILVGETQPDPSWLQQLDQAAHYWVTMNGDPAFAKHPPELRVDPEVQWPKYLLCEARLGRSFVLHTASPVIVVEILSAVPPADFNPTTPRLANLAGQTLVIHGHAPAAAPWLLAEISGLLGWLTEPAVTR